MNQGLIAPLPAVRTKRASAASSAPGFLKSLLFGRKYIPAKELEKIRHLVTETGFQKSQPYMTDGGIGKSVFRTLFGMGPNRGKVLKARLQQGGLFGKGGIIHGDVAFDPQLFEDIKKFRQGDRTLKRGLNILTEGGTGLMNVGFTAAAPLLTAAAALKGEASGGDVASEGLSTIGQSLGAPFGVVGAMGGGALGTALGGIFQGKDEDTIRQEATQDAIRGARHGLASAGINKAKNLNTLVGATPYDSSSFEAPVPEIYLPQQ
jgi:hypothetical protein